MQYLCTQCNYIYDEFMWDKELQIAPWTFFEELKEDFKCPICWSSKEYFHWIKEEVLKANDKNNLNLVEKKHIPNVKIKDNKIFVKIWETKHIMTDEHYIVYIELLDENQKQIDIKYLTSIDKPEAIFDKDFLDTFEVRAKCNLDWLWSTWLIK